jgi:hypothetical protein
MITTLIRGIVRNGKVGVETPIDLAPDEDESQTDLDVQPIRLQYVR